MFFASARSQAHFIFSKKVPGKKCHLLPHLPRHLTFFSVVSSPGIFCVFGDKSAWEKKSACKPGLQVSANYAGLLAALQKTSLNVIIQPISNPFKAFGCAYSQKKAIFSPKGHFCAVLGFPSDPPGCVWQYSTMFKHFSTQLGLLVWPLAKKYHLGQ